MGSAFGPNTDFNSYKYATFWALLRTYSLELQWGKTCPVPVLASRGFRIGIAKCLLGAKIVHWALELSIPVASIPNSSPSTNWHIRSTAILTLGQLGLPEAQSPTVHPAWVCVRKKPPVPSLSSQAQLLQVAINGVPSKYATHALHGPELKNMVQLVAHGPDLACRMILSGVLCTVWPHAA